MKADEINKILKQIYDKGDTTKEEKKALLEACGCVWESRMNQVIDIGSFMNMLYANMGYEYDVDVEEDEFETIFKVKTFIKSSGV